jgi:thiosulfate/3-mercaptopyruvate sulfurtransferase
MKKLLIMVVMTLSLFAMEPLVSVDWLKAHLHDKDLVIVDISSRKLYKKEHIPGAVHSGIGKWRKVHGTFALVRSLKEIEAHMRALGINHNSKVVLYSHHSNGKDMLKPSYVIWAMELYGLKQTAILDGGLKAWKSAGETLSTIEPTVQEGDFKAVYHPELVIDREGVQAAIGKVRMLDARPPIFYFGAKKQPILKRAGHISGASSYFWKFSFNSDGTMKPTPLLREMLIDGMKLDPKEEVITYCTGGLETSMNYFVLHRLLGFSKAKLYDASMREWANRDDTPMSLYQWE